MQDPLQSWTTGQDMHSGRKAKCVAGGVERNGVEVGDMINLVNAFRAGVLASHDIAAQINRVRLFSSAGSKRPVPIALAAL